MNPIASIEKLINERGSAKIMKERLALAGDQFAALEKENVGLRVQLAQVAEKVETLELSNADLEKELAEYRTKNELLDEPTAEVLKLLFNVAEGLALPSITSKAGMTDGEAKFHLGVLEELSFISRDEGSVGFAWSDGFGERHNAGGTPETFSIEQKGRAYMMKHG